MFKVGDEVWVRGKVTMCDESYVPYMVETVGGRRFPVEEDDLMPQVKTYTQGLVDAWELAKKIYDMTCTQIERIFDVDGGFWSVVREMTPEEALAKIEAYERDKQIKVGSIVIYHDCPGTGIVTYVDSEHATVMWENGRFGEYQKRYLEKTGETADGLDDLLRQIGE